MLDDWLNAAGDGNEAPNEKGRAIHNGPSHRLTERWIEGSDGSMDIDGDGP